MFALDTARLSLSPYSEKDRAAFADWLGGDRIEVFLGKSFAGQFQGDALFDAFVRESNRPTPGWLVWAVHTRAGGELIGHVELKHTSKTSASELEVIYAVKSSHQGRGVATEAVTVVTQEALSGSLCFRVVAYVNPLNRASRRVLEKSGFKPGASGIEQIGPGERWFKEGGV